MPSRRNEKSEGDGEIYGFEMSTTERRKQKKTEGDEVERRRRADPLSTNPLQVMLFKPLFPGIDADGLSRAASDEVWDCVIACLKFSSDGIRFAIVESSVVQHVEPDAVAGGGT